MEIQVKAILFKEGEIDTFQARVDDLNYPIVRKRLELEREKLINALKVYMMEGKIKSLAKPKNKDIQVELDSMIMLKRDLSISINKIKKIFY